MFIRDTRSRLAMALMWAMALFAFEEVLVRGGLAQSKNEPVSSSENQGTRALPTFDGNWWTNASSDERTGFLYALDDCLTYDLKPTLWFDGTWNDYEQKIDQYYSSFPANLATPVQDVFRRFGKKPAKPKTKDAGDRYGDEFWRSHNETARLGFLEGYFSCRASGKDAPRWSRSVSYYVGQLDDVYNADDRHGENASEYTGSIASALDKLRDSP